MSTEIVNFQDYFYNIVGKTIILGILDILGISLTNLIITQKDSYTENREISHQESKIKPQ